MSDDKDVKIALLDQKVEMLIEKIEVQNDKIEKLEVKNEEYERTMNYGKGAMKVFSVLGAIVAALWTIFTFAFNNLPKH
jgi:hypothetical protein